MTTRTHTLEADLATTASIAGAVTVVALPPSDFDDDAPYGTYSTGYTPLTIGSGDMRVYVGGVLTKRPYDPDVNA